MTVTRRSVLLASAAAPAGAALLGTSTAPADAAAMTASGRHTVALRDGWRFALVDPGGITDPTGRYADAAAPDHDDSTWRPPPPRRPAVRWPPRLPSAVPPGRRGGAAGRSA
ncbi:hypothetical protein AB0G81_13595, partial [Streptomyces asoensis]|uniref:hypothetical protein n=1 Tax=Streptomyces asoensis TaxID=249586 RepID=UPI0033E06949